MRENSISFPVAFFVLQLKYAKIQSHTVTDNEQVVLRCALCRGTDMIKHRSLERFCAFFFYKSI